MREIKFRAKSTDGVWKYGSYFDRGEYAVIYDPTDKTYYQCYLESLGQFTGMKDKTGKEVYEGDIIVCGHDTGKSYNRYVIEFSDSAHAYLARQVGCTSHIGSGYWGNTMLVIGNIHENPELLEVKR